MVPLPAVSPRTKLKFILGFLLLFGALLGWTAIYGQTSNLRIKFYDVGQGDAILIEVSSQTQVLIDGGPGKTRLVEYLSKDMPFWDRTIELVVLTHPHIDHAGGLQEVFRRYEVERVLFAPLAHTDSTDPSPGSGQVNTDNADESTVYRRFVGAVGQEGSQNLFTGAGERLEIGRGLELTVLWPSQIRPLGSTGENVNNLSVVLHLKYGDFDVLLTGDAEKDVQAQILSATPDVEVLKVPHHGSSDAFLTEFWEKASPELAVIMVGKNNKYAHPNRPVLEYLETSRIPYFRTDLHGTVILESDGKTFWSR